MRMAERETSGASGRFHEVASLWPLVVQQHVGTLSDAELDRQLADDARRLIDLEARDARHIAIFDMTWMGDVPPLQRERMGAFLRDNLPSLQRTLMGTAFVVPNLVKRGIVAAVFWVQRYPLPYAVVPDMDRALEWVLRHSESCGLELPARLHIEGVDAFRDELYTPADG